MSNYIVVFKNSFQMQFVITVDWMVVLGSRCGFDLVVGAFNKNFCQGWSTTQSGQWWLGIMADYIVVFKIVTTCILWFEYPTESLVGSEIPHTCTNSGFWLS